MIEIVPLCVFDFGDVDRSVDKTTGKGVCKNCGFGGSSKMSLGLHWTHIVSESGNLTTIGTARIRGWYSDWEGWYSDWDHSPVL